VAASSAARLWEVLAPEAGAEAQAEAMRAPAIRQPEIGRKRIVNQCTSRHPAPALLALGDGCLPNEKMVPGPILWVERRPKAAKLAAARLNIAVCAFHWLAGRCRDLAQSVAHEMRSNAP
jgi:hypothetical protein